MADEHDVRELALSLPGVDEGTSYGTSAFRVRDKLFARMHEDPDVLVLWCDDELEKRALIQSRPAAFFTTPHYDGLAIVLVRLSAIDADDLSLFITDAWRARAPKPRRT